MRLLPTQRLRDKQPRVAKHHSLPRRNNPQLVGGGANRILQPAGPVRTCPLEDTALESPVPFQLTTGQTTRRRQKTFAGTDSLSESCADSAGGTPGICLAVLEKDA